DFGDLPKECPSGVRGASRDILGVRMDQVDQSGIQVNSKSSDFPNGLSVTLLPDPNSWPQSGSLVGQTTNGSDSVPSLRKTALGRVLVVGTGGALGEVHQAQVANNSLKIGQSLFTLDYES